MKVVKAPNRLKLDPHEVSHTWIFLAGSIEMGAAANWQDEITEKLKNHPVVLLNPRRDNWDPTWKQEIGNPQFCEQVEWELDMLEQSDLIYMYFDPNTKSPVSLLEFGLFARTGKLVVNCPDGFWRKGNVDITCRRYGIRQVNSIDEFISRCL